LSRDLPEKPGASIAVSDASPLIALGHAGLVERLSLLFQLIMVPPSVMRELSVKEKQVVVW
jgi:predicted nucleic acid-binding protein